MKYGRRTASPRDRLGSSVPRYCKLTLSRNQGIAILVRRPLHNSCNVISEMSEQSEESETPAGSAIRRFRSPAKSWLGEGLGVHLWSGMGG
jgi:hypothetical protein